MVVKSSLRLSLCVTAIGFSSAACAVSDSELPIPRPTVYGSDAGSEGQAGSGELPSSMAGRGSNAGGSGVVVGTAGRGSNGGAAGMMAAAGSGAAGMQGGGAAGMMAAAGSGAAGDQGAAGDGAGGSGGEMAAAGSGGGDTCPTSYSTATHIVINVSWKGTTVLKAGSGQVHLWSKSDTVESGSTGTVIGQSCGSVLPAITTTAIAGSEKILPEMPDATWDAASMPKFTGSLTKNGNTVTIDPGVALVGLSMSNPLASWPSATSITGVDHDSDGNLGVTAIPKTTSGFSAPPTEITKTHRADKLYLAIRNVMTLSSTFEGCPETTTGTANVTNFENHVIGCHVKGGGECDSTQASFVDTNRTVFILGSATFSSTRISAAASCADVRAALPAQ
jgi:hypothetical protein